MLGWINEEKPIKLRTRPWCLTVFAGRENSRHMAGARKRWNEEDLKKSMISLFRGSGEAKLGRMKEQATGEDGDRVNNRFSF